MNRIRAPIREKIPQSLLFADSFTWMKWMEDVSAAGNLVATHGTQIVNVKDPPFNAQGDGVADDYFAIQAAVDALPDRGGVVFFPVGTYRVTDTIEIGDGSVGVPSTRNGIRLEGVGYSWGISASGPPHSGPVVIMLDGTDHNNTILRINGPAWGCGSSNITFTFNMGVGAAVDAIQDNGGNFGVFHNIGIIDPPRYGIQDIGLGTDGGQWNIWKNIYIHLAAANSKGILITTPNSGDVDRFFDSWENVNIVPSLASQTGIEFQNCDSIKVTNFMMNSGASGATAIHYNYSFTTDFPNGIVFWGCDVFDNIVTSTGSPPTNTNFMNRIYGYSQDNGSAIPVLGNLEIVNGSTASRTLGKQVDVTAANNLVLGTGNLNVVAGATQINLISITGWTNGSIVTLFFSSNPLLKNNQAASGAFKPFHLNAGADLVTTANDMVMLQLVSGEWWEVAPASVN